MSKILLSDHTGVHVVHTQEIMYCEAHNCYSVFYLVNGSRKVVCKTLKEFENELCKNTFARVHRKYLINMSHVRSFERRQPSRVTLTDDTVLDISFRRKKEFFAKFSRFMESN